jgi:penicillin G amidase
MKRVLRRLTALLIVLVLTTSVLAVWTVTRPFPQRNGTLQLPGLKGPVDIYRDTLGVPHIFAEDEEDLFFAQGFVHAQDRFWQMEMWRHIAAGRISEIVGSDTIKEDKFIRTVGWNRIAAASLANYQANAPHVIILLEAYSRGVNAYLADHRNEVSINATILGFARGSWDIRPWTPLDSIAWGVVMSDDLEGNWRSEVTRATLYKSLGEETVRALLPSYRYDERPVIAPTPDLSSVVPVDAFKNQNTITNTINWKGLRTDLIGWLPDEGIALGHGLGIGSNSWVVRGQHTASGLPLLANDTHLGIQMPSIWYEVALHAPGYNVVGFSFAGVPGVVIGYNDHIAWGVTNIALDSQDLYVEKLNPHNPSQYEFEGAWLDTKVITEVIKVNGGPEIHLPVRLTRHGPIISDVIDGSQEVLSMQWTAFEPSRLLEAILMLDRANNYEEFRQALRLWDSPAQNLVYADHAGNIAYQMVGRVPIRKQGDGLVPVTGWTTEYDWQGWVAYEELPALYNPPAGYIVAANNAAVDQQYPYVLSQQWDTGDRAQRITDMLEQLKKDHPLSPADFATMQLDTKSMIAARYQPLIATLNSSDPEITAALKLLRQWDLRLNKESVPAALFQIFYQELERSVLADEIGEENVDRLGNGAFFYHLADNSSAAWWDNVKTDAVETRDEIMLQALTKTVGWFESHLGRDMSTWTWGRIHTATFVSAPLGESGISLVETLVNSDSYAVDGGGSVVLATGYSRTQPAKTISLPAMRMIVDLSDPSQSMSVNSTGQSGHPFHKDYTNMIELSLRGKYHAMFSDISVFSAHDGDHLILTP